MAAPSFLFGVPVVPPSDSATLRDLVVVCGIALTFYFLCLLFLLCRFINARRRIVQPMIDQSNRAGKSAEPSFPTAAGLTVVFIPDGMS